MDDDVLQPIPRRARINPFSSTRHAWGWVLMDYDELQPIQSVARRSYVVRPYYRRHGSLRHVLRPVGGGPRVATATIVRYVPAPHPALRLPRSRDGGGVGRLAWAANRVLPVLVPRLRSIGTAAVFDSGEPLPALDLLPEPMRWPNPLRIGHFRALPRLPTEFGRPRGLPSGTALKRVPGPDLDYFAPLAVDPAQAARVLSPELLRLTREAEVGWWSEGSMLFVWMHDPLHLRERPKLAELAEQIHRELLR